MEGESHPFEAIEVVGGRKLGNLAGVICASGRIARGKKCFGGESCIQTNEYQAKSRISTFTSLTPQLVMFDAHKESKTITPPLGREIGLKNI
jgi:hypothetical protein